MNKLSSVSFIGDRLKDSPAKPYNARPAEIVNVCNLVVRDMHALLQGMFDGIDDSFFELANNARNNNEQNRFFEAMRDIRIKRKSIENSFSDQITAQFSMDFVKSKLKTEPTHQENTSFETLSLVQNDDLEEEVAISSMVNKASSNFAGPLLQFHTRVCNLFGIDDISTCRAPLDLKELTTDFSRACDILEIELKERLIVYKQFDRYVLSNLGQVLDEANKALIRLGILPTLKQARPKQHQSRVDSPADRSVPQAPTSVESAERLDKATTNLPQLQGLLANIRNNLGPGALGQSFNTTSQPTQFVSTQDLVQILTAIQHIEPLQQSGAEPKVINIHQELKKRINEGHEQASTQPKLKQLDDDLINLVSMLFEFILEDYNLAAPIQVLISRLQIPILKVVINDNTFFSSSKNPARKLLNSLARAGIGWNESQNKNDELYQAIDNTVQTILDEFEGDIKLFEKLYIEFEAFIAKQGKKSKIVEQRTKESEIGQIKSRHAQLSVEDKLDFLLANSLVEIPEIILDTIRGGWSRVMFLAFLKDEQEHQWEHTCKTVENLIWCLQPFEKPKDRQYWIAIAPKVLKELRSGLESVSYNSSDLDEIIVDIRTNLTNTFKQNSFNLSHDIHPQVDAKTFSTESTAIKRQQATENQSLSEYLEQVDQIQPGTWIEFSTTKPKQRCKLSAIVNSSQTYIFVTRTGLKACEKSKEDLAEDLKKENAIILEQSPLVDRALSALTRNLSQKANAI